MTEDELIQKLNIESLPDELRNVEVAKAMSTIETRTMRIVEAEISEENDLQELEALVAKDDAEATRQWLSEHNIQIDEIRNAVLDDYIEEIKSGIVE